MTQEKIGEDYFEELDVLSGGRRLFWNLKVLHGSVRDPDPEPEDPHGFGPPGSGSICQR
jgi:hypothetical protein